jgi:hypothetical protein
MPDSWRICCQRPVGEMRSGNEVWRKAQMENDQPANNRELLPKGRHQRKPLIDMERAKGFESCSDFLRNSYFVGI